MLKWRCPAIHPGHTSRPYITDAYVLLCPCSYLRQIAVITPYAEFQFFYRAEADEKLNTRLVFRWAAQRQTVCSGLCAIHERGLCAIFERRFLAKRVQA